MMMLCLARTKKVDRKLEGAKPTLKISDSSSNFLLFIEDDSAMFVFVGTIVHWPFLMICLLLSQRCDQCTIAQLILYVV